MFRYRKPTFGVICLAVVDARLYKRHYCGNNGGNEQNDNHDIFKLLEKFDDKAFLFALFEFVFTVFGKPFGCLVFS